MKRGFVLLCALGLACVIPLLASAKGPPDDKPEKVLIAHVEEVVEDYLNDETGEIGTLVRYVVIEVSDRSLDAHRDHGDIVPAPDEYAKGDHFEEFESDEPPPE